MVVRTTSEWLIFFLLLCNRRRIGLTVFFMGAILYALFLAIFSHYLYCGHYFMANNSVVVNEFPRNNEVFEVSEMKNTCIIKLGYNTRNGCMPKISKPRTEWRRNKSFYNTITDWASLSSDLKKLMPKRIFKQTETVFT